jgi:Fe-S cluster assembly protein SufD
MTKTINQKLSHKLSEPVRKQMLELISPHRIAAPNTALLIFIDGILAAAENMSPFEVTKTSTNYNLSLAANTTLEQPLQLLFITGTTPPLNTTATTTTITVNVGARSRLNIFEEHIDLGNTTDKNENHTTTNIKTEEAAEVNYYKIQNSVTNANNASTAPVSTRAPSNAPYTHVSHLAIALGKASVINTYHLLFGRQQQKSKEIISAKLAAPHARCINKGLYLLNSIAQLQLTIDIEHLAPACESKELFKGIMSQNARADFVGKIMVHQGAKQSIARLDNKNLLMDKTARATTSPALEIYADDVKCSHGATVGQLDEAALWYLQSRGIEKNEATQILIRAFIQEIINELPQIIQNKIRNYLPA